MWSTIAFLLFQLLEFSFSSDEFIIQREKQDTFVIPGSICLPVSTNQCFQMHGRQKILNKKPVNCTCECSLDNTRNVFGFSNNTWECQKNSEIRRKAGRQDCVVILPIGSLFASPLDVLPSNNWRRTIGFQENCELQSNFTYLDCKGEWMSMTDAHNAFRLDWLPIIGYRLHSWEETSFDMFQPSIRGKIINLRISCEHEVVCVTVKIRGKSVCPVMVSPTLDSTPNANWTTNGQSPPSNKVNTGIIAGVIGGLALLLVFCVILVLFKGIKKLRQGGIINDTLTTQSALDNPSYTRGEDIELAPQVTKEDQPYSYVTHSSVELIVNQPGLEKASEEPIILKNDSHYNVLECPVDEGESCSQSDQVSPVYTTLEDPAYLPLRRSLNLQSSLSLSLLDPSSMEEERGRDSEGPVYSSVEDVGYEKLQRTQSSTNFPFCDNYIKSIQEDVSEMDLTQNHNDLEEEPSYERLNLKDSTDYEKIERSEEWKQEMESSNYNKLVVEPDYEKLKFSTDDSEKHQSQGPSPHQRFSVNSSGDVPDYVTLEDPSYEKLKIIKDFKGSLETDCEGGYSTLEDPSLIETDNSDESSHDDTQHHLSTALQNHTDSRSTKDVDSTFDDTRPKVPIDKESNSVSDASKEKSKRQGQNAFSQANTDYETLEDPGYEKLEHFNSISQINGHRSDHPSQSNVAQTYDTLEHAQFRKEDENRITDDTELESTLISTKCNTKFYKASTHCCADSNNTNRETQNQDFPGYNSLEEVHHYERVQGSHDIPGRDAYSTLKRPENDWKTGHRLVLPAESKYKHFKTNQRRPIYSALNLSTGNLVEGNETTLYHVLDRPEKKWARKQVKSFGGIDQTNDPPYEVI